MNRLCRRGTVRANFGGELFKNRRAGEYLVDHRNCTYFPLVVSRSLVIKAVRLFQSGHKGVLLARFQTFEYQCLKVGALYAVIQSLADALLIHGFRILLCPDFERVVAHALDAFVAYTIGKRYHGTRQIIVGVEAGISQLKVMLGKIVSGNQSLYREHSEVFAVCPVIAWRLDEGGVIGGPLYERHHR